MELVSYDLPNKETLIMPIGDIQWAGEDSHTALRMLRDHIKWGVDQGVWFIGMGDYIDSFSPSNRAILTKGKLYHTARTSLDNTARQHIEELYEKALRGSEGRWLGLLEGHHFHEYTTGETTDMELCRMLQAPHLGSNAYVRLRFKEKASRPKSCHDEILIWCHHGRSAGQTAGAVLRKLERVAGRWRGDIFIQGHAHTKDATVIDRIHPIYMCPPKLVHRTVALACTGGFLKGYVEGSREGHIPRGTYVEQAMLPPVALGGVLFKIKPRWVRHPQTDGRIWLPDIRVEL